MLEATPSENGLGIHVVLATLPQRQEKEFLESVEKDYYQRYREDLLRFSTKSDSKPQSFYYSKDKTQKTPVLYKPIKYHLFGNYDVAFISLIDNFKFAQRLLEPELKDKDAILAPYSFQGFTGISYDTSDHLKSFFYERLKQTNPVHKYFLGVCNLKLNNAFLIGNGKCFLESVRNKIKDVIEYFNKEASEDDKIDWLTFHPFSWFEQSIIMLTNNPQSLIEVIRKLRSLSVNELNDHESIVDASLYRSLFEKVSKDSLAKANVFADTHTYFGIHERLVENPVTSQYFIDFLRKAKKLKFKTEIELQVKPGHMHLLLELLKKENKKTPIKLDLGTSYLLAGKSDYLLREKTDDVSTNVFLLRLTMNPNSGIYDHIRKMRTRLLFEVKHYHGKEKERKSLSLHTELKKLAKSMSVIREMDRNLKALKVSRQIRNKIHKIFTNYNNGIQDAILFIYFLDFKVFIEDLQELIETEYKSADPEVLMKTLEDWEQSDSARNMVSVLENKLMKRIEIFQEGYNIRMLNCYQYEDIADFDLDFNSSIQQLLSAYNSLILEIGNNFYAENYQYGPVVQLNLKDTVSTYNSINYYIHHLTSPEIVFATITKEILNCDQYDTKVIKDLHNEFNKLEEELERYNSQLSLMMREGLVDINYFLIDTTRFVLTYDLQFDLFYYWFWLYNLQNTMLYDKTGLINERHFRKELFRILTVSKFFGIDDSKVKCPLPELQTYWDRHYNGISSYVDIFLKFLKEKKLAQKFANSLVQRFEDFYSMYGEVNDAELKVTEETVEKLKPLTNLKTNYSTPFNQKSYYVREMRYRDYRERNGFGQPEDVREWYFYMAEYLQFFFKENKGEFNLLRRNWRTGQPLEGFIQLNSCAHIYSIDQTGGLFFDDMQQLNRYYGISVKTISRILHFSYIAKKRFFLHQINEVANDKK